MHPAPRAVAPATPTHPRTDAAPSPARRCANPRSRRRLPANAAPTRRHCSATCRQACHRDRHRPTQASTVADTLAQAISALAEHITAAAADVTTSLTHPAATPGPGPLAETAATGTAAVAPLAALADQLLRIAVAHDRARGAAWPAIAAVLRTHPETARRRYRHTTTAAVWAAHQAPKPIAV
jgi:hypothetical protein